jgi:hypothetical protein
MRRTGFGVILRILPSAAFFIAPALCAQAKPRAADLPRAFRSIAGVELNRDSARSIQAKLGSTPTQRIGSGHDTYLVWCYQAQVGDSIATVELMSDESDMGTRGHALNIIRLRSSKTNLSDKCGKLPSDASLATSGGLRLGLRRADVERILGTPTRRSGDSLVYDFVAKEYMAPSSAEYKAWNTPKYRKECFAGGPPFANVGATAIVRFANDRTIEIRLERYDQSTC